jgi:hypothetical protein
MQCNAMQCNYTDLVHHADTVLMSLPCSQVAFRRCGGRSAMAGINAPDPGICCESGTLCKFYNKYFWQCQPRGYVPLPEPEATYDGATCSGKTQVGRCCRAHVCDVLCLQEWNDKRRTWQTTCPNRPCISFDCT